jgi:hypothetical protein
MKCVIKPVITGATEIATRGLKKHSEAMPGKHSLDSLQKQLYFEHNMSY